MNDHMNDRNVTTASAELGPLLSAFERMMAKAPDGPAQEHALLTPPNPLRTANGWPARFVEKVELRDVDGWLTKFEKAQRAVSQGGLVALIGLRGTGKTRMAAEIARAGYFPTDKGEWNGNRMTDDKSALYRRSMDVFMDFRATMTRSASKALGDVVEALQRPGLLVIDEFHEAGETAFEKSTMTNLLDRRFADERPTILIANFSAEELGAALGPSIADRMHENGRIIRFEGESFRRNK
jgi:DNA replication protein DnaC